MTVLMRCIFAGLLLATVAGRIQAFSAVPFDEVAGVTAFLEGHGWSVREQSTPKEVPFIRAAAPGCAGLLQVMRLSLSLEAVPYFEAVAEPGYVRTYIYFGQRWRTPDPVALRSEWIKHRALSLLGLRRHVMHKTLLLVAAPPYCKAVSRIDWRPLWEAPAP